MTVLVTFVRDTESGDLIYGVVATDKDATRIGQFSTEKVSEEFSDHITPENPAPTDALGWTQLALLNQSAYAQSQDPFEVPDEATGVKEVKNAIELGNSSSNAVDPPDDAAMLRINATDETEKDHPGWIEDLEDPETPIDHELLLNHVMMALGDIDPNGPNGWLIRASEGTPPSENDYIHWETQPIPFSPPPEETP